MKNSITRIRKAVVLGVAISYLSLAFLQTATAAMIGTPMAIEAQQRETRIVSIQAGLAREDVRTQLVHMGVDPSEAQARVAALTDSELILLEREIDHLPAGAGVFELIGIVFVVLLILELTGVTDIFKKL